MIKIKHLFSRITAYFFRFFRPQMVGGYRDGNGKFLSHVRIGNTTQILCREKLVLEDYVYIGHYNFLDASHGLIIAEGCQISNFVSVLNHSSHTALRLYGKDYIKVKHPEFYHRGSVKIGKYSFIGPHVVIMPQTNIGKGSIVAAYSYVEGDFPDYAIIKGNPAKVVGSTRDADKKLIDEHPQFFSSYHEWVD